MITISIDDDRLHQPAVGRALADLFLALGGIAQEVPVVAPEPEKPRVALREGARRTGKQKRAAKPQPKTWAEYRATFTAGAEKAVAFIENAGRPVTGTEIGLELGIGGKGVGGTMGAMRRKAVNLGLTLPLALVKTSGGKKVWVWTV